MKGEGIGTYTKYNFSNDKYENGLKKNSSTVIAHEVQHQFDFDQGNMKDSYDKNGKYMKAKAPAEQRAIKNEDLFRKQDNLDLRREY
jgi:Mlc titration factor MtfA (ptsG expression regulator)